MKKLICLLLAGSLCVAVNAQTYIHPTLGMQNTYEGACMVSTASGIYYDNGGSAGNYAANINAIYRTFCPSAPGMMVRLTFTSFSMNDTYFLCSGPNSCCDYLTIYDGPNTSSPVIYNNCTTSPGTITANNPTGCLTVVQVTDGSVQLAGWSATVTNVPAAGGPLGTLNNDCSRATPVCNGSIVVGSSSAGPGLVSETCSGCALSEVYSAWYKIGIATSGTLAFTLDPTNNANDYDFALYGPNVTCGALGTPIRCTKAGVVGTGNTGMGNGAVDASEDITGDQWVSELNVTAGQTYYLMINQKDDGYSGFNLSWTGTATLSAISIASTTQTNVSCFGGSNGSASIATPTGGVAPYTYDWSPGAPTGDGTTSVSGLTAGTWTCTVTDASGCTLSQVFSIAQPPSAVTVTALSQTNVSCFGGSNGAASVNAATGGAGGYTYNWTPGNPTGDGTTSVTGLTAGSWTCTVTDANACVATQTFNITAPSAISLTAASQTNVACNGGSTGAASVNAATGGAGGFTYNWTPGNPTGDGTTSVTGLTAGSWTCTATDANACVATQTFNITAPTAISLTAASQTNVACNGGSNGAASVNAATGGAGGYTYNWTPGNPTGDGTTSVTGLTAGTWTCTVTDANACVASQTFNITAPGALVASSSAGTITCNGGSTTVTVTATSGTSPYTGTGTFTVTAGTYTYTVTDANGCTNSTTVTITQPAALVATSSSTSIQCNGGSATVTVTGSGGTAPYSGTGTFTVTAGTYSYTVTDANGCTTSTSITVTEPTALSATSSATSIACNGGSSTVTVVASGGTSPYTGDGTFTVTAGTYSFTVTDANGCTSTTTGTVTEPAAISTSVTTVNVACNGDSTGSIDLTVTGGTSPYTFDWNSGAFTTEDLSNLPAGTYIGVLTDANGCTDGGSIIITEPPVLVATVSASSGPTTCGGTDGSIDLTISGGTVAYSFLWNTSAITEDIVGVPAGLYSCTVTDANGCTTTASDNLNDPDSPVVTLTLSVDTICSTDGPMVLSGESPSGGTFSGPGVSAGMFDPSVAGVGTHTISYTFTDTAGCTASISDSINVDICLTLGTVISTSEVVVYPNPNRGLFTLVVTSGASADVLIFDAVGKVIWTQNVVPKVPNQIEITESGVYMIHVITANGERMTQRLIITE